ncbi:unnamed protein product [Cladocopium goreaui]|uniref:Photosystem II 12 kDa extrinsic protein n=1 Tax=Cladocopium goreaui TaxID=2562237 RepID=A0A9P1DR28_9DINO|nr:unnamed protein product [Cladocopium goreaui]
MRFATLLLLLAPCAAYVAPGTAPAAGAAPARHVVQQQQQQLLEEETNSGTGALLASGFGLGALLGWMTSRKQQIASTVAAVAVAVPAAANAMVDYDNIQYLGGSDKVDINNANIQAYRQFPGMFPTISGLIATHGPYKQVSDIYNIPGMEDKLKNIVKKYEGNLVCLPANPAYFIDRINNGNYR